MFPVSKKTITPTAPFTREITSGPHIATIRNLFRDESIQPIMFALAKTNYDKKDAKDFLQSHGLLHSQLKKEKGKNAKKQTNNFSAFNS